MTDRTQGWSPEGKAMCYPSDRMLVCATCARFRNGWAMPPEQRTVVVINASVVVKDGVCPMYEHRPIGRPYVELAERETA